MFSRLQKIPKDKSFFLFGPRGTGKTTWVKSAFPASLYIDLLEAELFNDLLANPQRLDRLIPSKHQDWIIIDEIQRVPEMLNEVHRLIENRRLKFILTGSSPRKLRKSGSNLLAGRALSLSFHPLCAAELGESYSLKHSLLYGQLPCVYTEGNPKAYLQSYVKTYLEQEIQFEGLTRNLSAFSRFLEAASFSQGALLNISAVSQECGVERKVVENYFSILEDLLIAHRIPVFTKRAKRRLTAHPKFFYFDAGVYRILKPKGPLDTSEESEGAGLETLFLQEVMAVNAALNLGYNIYYWHTSNDMEVDFILYGEKGFFAFEIKRTHRINSEFFKGLKAFKNDYPESEAFFLYGGERRYFENDIKIIPFETFIRELPETLSRGNVKQ